MAEMIIAAVAAHFGRSIERALPKVAGIIDDARRLGVSLLVFPDATLGGYLTDLREPDLDHLPEAIGLDSIELREIQQLAGDMTVCIGFSETAIVDGRPVLYNSAVCLSGAGIHGVHRKVHRPLNESRVYEAGDGFAAFDTPVGRLGMLIDYDKTFPEAARALADDGAHIIACLSAWPASTTNRAERLTNDRQSRLFDIYDGARAAENQIVLVSSNQTGVSGGLRFLGQAKVVGPGGDVLSKTWSKGALAVTTLDVEHEVTRARRTLHHLAERMPAAYGRPAPVVTDPQPTAIV
ncbi:MAG: carbon-nitrogen hydrolase family protein [Glaciihabitans sp.]|nr:carbon-nitrogen hydrolase family protein [Glaciihabitans sp.]